MAETADAALRRRYRATTARLERFGADEDTAQLVAAIVQHLEAYGHVRIEHHEVAALAGVLTLVLRNMNERAAREQGLLQAVG